jgi:deoxyribonuclease-4
MELGMESCQLFTKNERQWLAKPLDPAVIERFHAKTVESGFDGRLVAHDSYLINIASPDDALREKSRLALMDELDRCDQLGIPYLVSHPGAHVGSGVDAGLARVAESINQIHAERPDGKVMLLLETTAGQGTTLGRTFAELAEILARLADKTWVGVCFDTCHTFAAGYELRTAEGYASTMTELDRLPSPRQRHALLRPAGHPGNREGPGRRGRPAESGYSARPGRESWDLRRG